MADSRRQADGAVRSASCGRQRRLRTKAERTTSVAPSSRAAPAVRRSNNSTTTPLAAVRAASARTRPVIGRRRATEAKIGFGCRGDRVCRPNDVWSDGRRTSILRPPEPEALPPTPCNAASLGASTFAISPSQTDQRLPKRRRYRNTSGRKVGLNLAHKLDLEPPAGREITDANPLSDVDATVPTWLHDSRRAQPPFEHCDAPLEQGLLLARVEVSSVLGQVPRARSRSPQTVGHEATSVASAAQALRPTARTRLS